jgi:hypothetical protein
MRKEYKKSHPMNLIAKLLMNSLYGKFGMKLEMKRVDIHTCETEEQLKDFTDLVSRYGESILDYVKIGNNYIIVRDSYADIKYIESEDLFHGVDVNIALASAITAYSRIYMSLKNNPNFNLYYSDTDSIIIDKELPSEFVGDELNQLKLEYEINKAVFLAPKVYGLETIDGKEIIKVKGLSNEKQKEVSLNDLYKLLPLDSTLEFNQEKWNKNVLEGRISILDIVYTLKVTSNKRKLIYENNRLSNTRPLNYNEI